MSPPGAPHPAIAAPGAPALAPATARSGRRIAVAPAPRWATTGGTFQAAILLAALGAYIATGKFGLAHALVNRSASAVWLPSGIALGTVLAIGMRALPVVWAGAFVVNCTTAGTVVTSAVVATGNMLEAAIAAWLLRRWCADALPFTRPQHLMALVPVVLAGCAVAATVGTVTLHLAHLAQGDPWPVWMTWWWGDALGALIAAPPVALWILLHRRPDRIGEGILVMAVAAAVGWLAVRGMPPASPIAPVLGVLCLPPILWAGLRLGPRMAATTTLILMAFVWYGLVHGSPWARMAPADANAAILILQAFMAVTTLTGLAVAAVVAEREHLEAALAERALALARSNADLERFAAVASHDLKEPLRMIRVYQQLAERRAQGQLPPEAVQALASAGQHAQRMLHMIDALLQVAQATSAPPRLQRVAVAQVLAQVLELYAERVRETKATILVQELPEVWCDPDHLAQVLQNILGNALKFATDAPRVEVSAQRDRGSWILVVRDHGIGIDPRERDRIFGMFQRLSNAQAFPGTGIGLATCRRLVEGMGGTIMVDGAEDGGTCVRIQLPDARGAPR